MTQSVLAIEGINPVSFVRRVQLNVDPSRVFNNGLIADGVLANFALLSKVQLKDAEGNLVGQDLNIDRDKFIVAEHQLLPVLCEEINKQWAEYKGVSFQCMDLTGTGLNREYIVTITVNLSKWSKGYTVPSNLNDLFPIFRNMTLPDGEQDVVNGTSLWSADWEQIVMDGVVGEEYMSIALSEAKTARVDGVLSGLKTFLPRLDIRAVSHPDA